MVRHRGTVLVDTNVILEAHRTGTWRALTGRLHRGNRGGLHYGDPDGVPAPPAGAADRRGAARSEAVLEIGCLIPSSHCWKQTVHGFPGTATP